MRAPELGAWRHVRTCLAELEDGRPRLVSMLLLLELGHVDARLAAELGSRLRNWTAGELLPMSAAEYRRLKRDILLCALALTLAPEAGPATRARRVAAFLRSTAGELGRYSTRAQQLAAELAHLGERLPGERQLRNVLRSISATQAARDFLIAR